MKYLPFALLLAAPLALFCACGTGGDGRAGGVTADLLIGDSPVDDLLSFSAVVQSVRLRRDNLTFTEDLIGSLEVEFLGLNGSLAFLSKESIPPGTYVAVQIGFAPGQYQAKANDGSDVTVTATSDTYIAALLAPVTVTTGDYVRFSVDLDLLSSLSDTVGTGSVDFGPSGSCGSDDGSTEAPIDELRGTVVSSDSVAQTVTVDGTVGNPAVAIGRVSVHVSGTTVLLDNNNATLTISAFFAAIPAGTLMEIHGNLGAGGTVEATRIELEDAGGGASVARIAGVVNSVGSGVFNLQIADIKDGETLVNSVLNGLGNPADIDCSFAGGTSFTFDTGGVTSSASLAVGQDVKVRFSAFATEPFPASEVEIDDTPGFTGTLSGAQPGMLTLRMDAGDATVRGGGVRSTATEVSLVLGSAPLVLDVPGTPAVEASWLVPGLVLEPRGHLSGTPDAPVITAERVLVRPGYLRHAELRNVAGDSLVVDGGEFVDSFGRRVTPGPLAVWLQEGCTFTGDARSAEAFRTLVQSGARLELDVQGLPNEFANEIRAFAIRVQQR